MNNPEVYTAQNLIHTPDEGTYISVRLASKSIDLPIKSVATSDQDLLLAWVDAKRTDLAEAGAEALAEILNNLKPGLLITPYSSKSIPMAMKAAELFNKKAKTHTPLIVLAGGKNLENIRNSTEENGFVFAYNPVTSSHQQKYIAISTLVAEVIKEKILQGAVVAILDDVYGSGATINAVRDTIRMAVGTQIPNEMLPAVVVAREVEGEYKGQELDDVLASIILPIIVSAKD